MTPARSRSRQQNLTRLLEHVGAPLASCDIAIAEARYAVSLLWFERDGGPTDSEVVLQRTMQESFETIADAILDGWAPDGVYDLDTGDKTEVHVATPIVTRAEDQGITDNPLKDRS